MRIEFLDYHIVNKDILALQSDTYSFQGKRGLDQYCERVSVIRIFSLVDEKLLVTLTKR